MKWYLTDDMITNREDQPPVKWMFFKSENDDNVIVELSGASDDLINEVLALLVEDRTPPLDIRSEDELRAMGLFKPKREPLRLVDRTEHDGEV